MTTILCKTCSPRKGCFVYQNGGNRTECKFYQPLTNEEWLRQASTEELAKFLSDETLDSFFRHAHGDLPRINGTLAWAEWLKAPHKE